MLLARCIVQKRQAHGHVGAFRPSKGTPRPQHAQSPAEKGQIDGAPGDCRRGPHRGSWGKVGHVLSEQ